jgi:hypothetical protein
VSWGAHQFEIYAIQAHLPRRMRGRISFFGVWLGDFTPDFLSKFWVYGVTIGSTHLRRPRAHRWHRAGRGLASPTPCPSACSSPAACGCGGAGGH